MLEWFSTRKPIGKCYLVDTLDNTFFDFPSSFLKRDEKTTRKLQQTGKTVRYNFWTRAIIFVFKNSKCNTSLGVHNV